MSSYVHVDNIKYTSILGKGSKQGLDNTKLTVEAEYYIILLDKEWNFV